jgi:hypothetical protein
VEDSYKRSGNIGGRNTTAKYWIILPLLWTFGRAFHVITVHIWWSIRYKEYSPGLVTGLLFWILVYFVIRYGLRPGLIAHTDFLIGMIGGFAGALFLAFLPTTIMPRVSRRKQARVNHK